MDARTFSGYNVGIQSSFLFSHHQFADDTLILRDKKLGKYHSAGGKFDSF